MKRSRGTIHNKSRSAASLTRTKQCGGKNSKQRTTLAAESAEALPADVSSRWWNACLYAGLLLIAMHFLYRQHCRVTKLVLDGNCAQEQQHAFIAPHCGNDETNAALVLRPYELLQENTTMHFDKQQEHHAPDSHATTHDSGMSDNNNHNDNAVVVDMISISSQSRPHYPLVQQASFGSHYTVRHFWTFTEDDDDDVQCHNMTVDMVQQIARTCRHNAATYAKLPLMKQHFAHRKQLLHKTKNPVGWLCAQKRPLMAMHRVLQGYDDDAANDNNNKNQTNNNSLVSIPDYLFVMDDDSWFHLEHMLPVLQHDYPPHEAHLIAGCLIRSPKDERFAFHWGGFGIVLTRAVIRERLLVPLTCNVVNHTQRHDKDSDNDDWRWSHHLSKPALPRHDTYDFDTRHDFVQYACHRIALNLVGERHFYQLNNNKSNDMTLMDLIYQYSRQQPYSRFDQWRPDATYCMHSDTTLAYFWQYYHVAQHANVNHRDSNNSSINDEDDDDPMHKKYANVDYDRIEAYRGSIKIKVNNSMVSVNHTNRTPDILRNQPKLLPRPLYSSRGECTHISNNDCTTGAHLCHYVTASHMKTLFEAIHRQAAPGMYRPSKVARMPQGIELANDVIAKHPDAIMNQNKRRQQAKGQNGAKS